jgi:hypothetical protein
MRIVALAILIMMTTPLSMTSSDGGNIVARVSSDSRGPCEDALLKPGAARVWARKAWNATGRSWLYQFTGVKWDPQLSTWRLDSTWRVSDPTVATQAYFAEYVLRPAVELAVVTGDDALLNELAGFYLTYLPRFTTLGAARRQFPSAASGLLNQGNDDARTLIDIQAPRNGNTSVRECVTCTLQFLYPAARLIRVIAEMPTSRRTASMRQLARIYSPLIVNEQVLRLAYEAKWSYWGAKDLPTQLVKIWQEIRTSGNKPERSYQHAMLDSDLWLMVLSAEMIAANHADSALVPISKSRTRQLSALLDEGVSLLQSKRHLNPETKNFAGRVVGSASYFDGDFVDHPDFAYAGLTSDSLAQVLHPEPRSTSWDISHSYRLPVLLHSLAETRHATHLRFPSDEDIRLLVRQYLYRVFDGDWQRPRFNNFLDGSDGWYRVDPTRHTGIPPSRFCDTRSGSRPCLSLGAVFGWGMLASYEPDLTSLQHALIEMALSTDAPVVEFRARYYSYGGESFAACGGTGDAKYPFLLFEVVASAARVL